MSAITGNYIKTSLYIGDMREDVDPAISRDEVVTIQSFGYSISKGRNANGDPHGGVKPSTVNFVIRSPKVEQSRKIYRLLREGEVLKLSFLFNPYYNLDGDLADQNAATVIAGVVTSAREEYDSQQSKSSETRIMMRVSMMIYSITYIGSSNEHTLRFK